MKGRTWVPVTVLLLAAVAAALVLAFRTYDLDGRLHDYIVGQVAQRMGGQFDVGSVYILPDSFGIRDARLRLRDIPLVIEAKRIRIEYDLLAFIRNRFRFSTAARTVVIERPRFSWLLDETEGAAEPSPAFSTIPVLSLKDLPEVSLMFEDGSLALVRDSRTFAFASAIRGWLEGRGRDIRIAVEGCVLSDSLNTTFRGTMDRTRDVTALQADIHGADLSREGLDVLLGDIATTAGAFDLSLGYRSAGDSVSVSGGYDLRDASFALAGSGIRFDGVAAAGRITPDEILIDGVTCSVWGADATLSGVVGFRPSSYVRLQVTAEGIDLGPVVTDLLPKSGLIPEARIRLEADIEGPLTDIAAGVAVATDTLSIDGECVTDLRLRADIRGGTIRYEAEHAFYRGHQITATGTLADMFPGGERTKDASFSGRIRAVPREGGPRLNLAVTGRARPDREWYTASCTLVTDRPGPFEKITGVFTLDRGNLQYRVEAGAARIEGTADKVFDEPGLEGTLTLADYPLFNVLDIPGDIRADGAASFTGKVDSLAVAPDIRLRGSKNLETRLTGKALLRNLASAAREVRFDGELRDHRIRYAAPATWQVSIQSDSVQTAAQLLIPGGATFAGSVVHGTGALSGKLSLDAYPLESIIGMFDRGEFQHKGRITGNVTLGGTIREPRFASAAPVTVADLRVGGLDRLNATVMIAGDLTGLRFTDAVVTRKDLPILSGQGIWVRGKPFVVEASGRDIHLDAIDDILSDTQPTNGLADYDLTLRFTQRDGTIEGRASVHDGRFLGIPFDRASAVIGGGSNGFTVTDLVAEKTGVYRARGTAGSGYFWKDATPEAGLRATAVVEGNLMAGLPPITSAISKASGQCRLTVTLGGTWIDPRIRDGELQVTDGRVTPAFLADEVTGITALLDIDPEIRTRSGLTGVRIKAASGLLQGRKIIVRNLHPDDEGYAAQEMPELLTVINSTINMDFGLLTGRMDRQEFRDPGVELNVPGFMKPQETASLFAGSEKEFPFLVGAAARDDGLDPFISGTLEVLSADITWPLLETGEESGDTFFLEDIYWNLKVIAGSNVNYFQEHRVGIGQLAGTTVSRTYAKLEENSWFTVRGRFSDGSFRVAGDATSMSGTITYYGSEFDIERADLVLDTTNSSRPAMLTARASTIVYDDSTSADSEIYLHVDSVDPQSGRRQEAPGRVEIRDSSFYERNSAITFDAGGLGTLQITFTSTNPADNTQVKILARLGVSSSSLGDTAVRAFTAGVDNYYFDGILRPFENVVRRYTRLDIVRFTPSVLGNLVQSRLGIADRFGPDNEPMLFDRTRVLVGEYFFQDWFLSYRGQYGTGRDFLQRHERGFYHEFGLQYLMERNTRIQLNYNYDEIIRKGDRRLMIRHDFEF